MEKQDDEMKVTELRGAAGVCAAAEKLIHKGMYEEEQEGISYQTPDRVRHGGSAGRIIAGVFPAGLAMAEARERLRRLPGAVCPATESDAGTVSRDLEEPEVEDSETEEPEMK